MAADSDGSPEPLDDSVTTIVTCEGDYYDPTFHDKFKITLDKLENILCQEHPRKQSPVKNSPCRTEMCCEDSDRQCIKVAKLEPWNSVRVTLSIPREVAARLRQMANEGSEQLRQLGILSVQVEGDQVISLRIASRFGNEEVQEIVLNTTASPAAGAENISSSAPAVSDQQVNPLSASTSSISRFLQNTTPSAVQQASIVTVSSTPSEFRSPNVVCPSDTQVPLKVTTSVNAGLVQQGTSRGHEALSRPFPFASMQQAAIAIQNRQQDFHRVVAGVSTSSASSQSSSYTQPPPPYPSNKIIAATSATVVNTNTPPALASTSPSGQNIAISSPLLVNLLQNEGGQNQKADNKSKPKVPAKLPPSLIVNDLNRVPQLQQTIVTTSSSVPSSSSSNLTKQPPPPVLVSQPTTNNPRLQQAQQLRTLQQQLIQKQSQHKILAQQTQAQIRVTTASTVAPTPYRGTQSQTPQLVQAQVTQPPPYHANRTITAQQQALFKRVQQPTQQRLFTSQFPTSNVPDFSNSSLLNNQTVIAQPMPHLGQLTSNNHIDTSLLNITPSLTDISKDLDSLLPSLTDLDATDLNDIVGNLVPDDVVEAIAQHEQEQAALQLTSKPIEMPNELTSKGKKRLFLINPSNGMLEPMPSDESSPETDASDTEESKKNVMDVFSEFNDYSNSIYSDEDTNSMSSSFKRGVFDTNSDSSDTNKTTDSSNNNKSHRPKNFAKIRRDSPNYVKGNCNSAAGIGKLLKEKIPTEKIKLRLKLEKNEPVNPAYKAELSFINRPEPKLANSSPLAISNPLSTAITTHSTGKYFFYNVIQP